MADNFPQKKYDFFISFSNRDVEQVKEIVNLLENTFGAVCWFQLRDSKDEYMDAIIEGIENSSVFLVFVSAGSAESAYVRREIGYAMEWREDHEDYKILPIVIDPQHNNIKDEIYKKIRFLLGSLNALSLSEESSLEDLVLKIFDQTGYEVKTESLQESFYHSSDIEMQRLKSQNEILRDFSKDFFDRTVQPDYPILDIGCANGDNIMLRLEGLEYGGLLGVDIEEVQVERAATKYGSDKNTFVNYDVQADGFEEILEDYLEEKDARGFDLIHISALLMHLVKPMELLRVLRHFLKKNGYLFIQDEDDGVNIAYPHSKFYDYAFKIWLDSKESGDRYCARKIPSYLSQAGYSRCSLAKCGVSSAGLADEQREAFWDIYFNYHLWAAPSEELFYHLDDTKKLLAEYEKMYDEQKQLYDEGKTFIQLGFLFFIAQK